MNKSITLGVTGGIGSGKTTVCDILDVMGCPIYNADQRARWLMENDPELISSIIGQFGEESFLEGKLNRDFLAQKVFSNEEYRESLNNLVHPVVGLDFDRFVSDHIDCRVIVKEAALLFETGAYKKLDRTVLVVAPLEKRLEWIKKRDPFRSDDEIKKVMSVQMDEKKKAKLADFIITNDESTSLIIQVAQLLKDL